MKYGSLPRWIARSLPVGPVEPDHAPDGLTESNVDAMAAEAGIDLELPDGDQPIAPVIQLRPPLMYGGEAA